MCVRVSVCVQGGRAGRRQALPRGFGCPGGHTPAGGPGPPRLASPRPLTRSLAHLHPRRARSSRRRCSRRRTGGPEARELRSSLARSLARPSCEARADASGAGVGRAAAAAAATAAAGGARGGGRRRTPSSELAGDRPTLPSSGRSAAAAAAAAEQHPRRRPPGRITSGARGGAPPPLPVRRRWGPRRWTMAAWCSRQQQQAFPLGRAARPCSRARSAHGRVVASPRGFQEEAAGPPASVGAFWLNDGPAILLPCPRVQARPA